ncbi:mevalonate kinase [Fructilactobacillus sanfranciscensis]|uniref:mevalonate kinase n=1 Tax=Fructilactobacillus sanfranciscensis TaxID=1625 RepID=UPI000CD42540|nr:mevalonate kinase [Fructilactobacillus sanfranciscensis]NDR69366.1 mevalonate kinase [Fructilactobacillus sanfranciscensis]NDS15974.1 mevalonate kinase [Fructilactobacillus sanfranciscensis]POH21085.1 mevalonate kinase [Fructilactobacillus sanfranciscensis]
MNKEAIGKSHAKVIFLGEHSAVYQKPAIVFPLPQIEAQVTIKPIHSNESEIESKYFNGPLSELPTSMTGISQLIERLNELLNPKHIKFSIQIISEIPLGRGMGSSAATSAALTRAYFAYFEKSLDKQELDNLINVEESITHGNPSGIDAKTVISDQPILFENGHFTPISFNTTGFIIIADTGISSNTKIAVDEVHNRLNYYPELVKQEINQLGNLTEQVKLTLNNNDIKKTGQLMNDAQMILSNLGVSSFKLDHLISVAKANDALGAKLTGSGMGGCIIALCGTLEKAQLIKKQLLNNGAKSAWIQSLNELTSEAKQ